MTNKITSIIDALKCLTLSEAVDLVKEIEKVFDVDASVKAATVATPAFSADLVATSKAAEEKTSFDVLLTEVPSDKKIAILKVIRSVTGLGLKESKDIVDNTPRAVKEAISKDESENIKKELELAGAKVVIK
jgi:large subunit ribosomal protein L7/L12